VVTSTLNGLVLERDGAVYRVLTDRGEVRAILRGKVKQKSPKLVVGDRVQLDPEAQADQHAIVSIDQRSSLLARRVPEGRGDRSIAANVDQVLVVTATRDPAPLPQLIDRLLVVAEANRLPVALIFNKLDLESGDALAARFTATGYTIHQTSVKRGDGIDELRQTLHDRISVVTGPSGAGKSSLLNAVEPGLKLRTGEISEKIKRGKNTTVGAIMVPLAGGGFLVDTPGFSEVGLWGLAPRELAECFPEFRPLIDQCKYADCSHTHEPGCAVNDAARAGEVDAGRVDSYRRLLSELQDAPQEWE
jgi:ribosome biogenesis GTPase